MVNVIEKTNIPNYPLKRGKVRDIYDLGERLLIVASDRLSAFDFILPNPIPYKGMVLTNLSIFWFDLLKDLVKTHFISADLDDLPDDIKEEYKETLDKRFMIVKKADVVPFECVVRGYLAGSGWKEYQKSQTVCGIKLPGGLKHSSKLPEPIFTPATKAESGHDENVSFKVMADSIGAELADKIRDLSIRVYQKAYEYARSKSIIISDTKFEWGLIDGKLILVDEVLTPDSSRFWPLEQYEEGKSQASFDKQFVRDYLESSGWDKTPPPPQLPPDVIEKTSQKYLDAYTTLTGKTL